MLKRSTLLAAALALLTSVPALAVLNPGSAEWKATYVAAFQPQFGTQGVPYSGIMKVSVNHGIISGTYESTSSRPDPMYGRIINITGTISQGSVILHIASLTILNGTIDHKGTISGTATWQGRLWNFLAKVKSSP